MSDSSKRAKPTLESLLKNSQLQTGKKLINKILVKEQELVLFKQSAEFKERNRKKMTFKTRFLLQKAVYLPVQYSFAAGPIKFFGYCEILQELDYLLKQCWDGKIQSDIICHVYYGRYLNIKVNCATRTILECIKSYKLH